MRQWMIAENGGALLPPADRGTLGWRDFEAQPWESMSKYSDGGSANSRNLLEYCRILRKHARFLVLVMALTTLLAWLLTLPQDRIFRATTSVEVQSVNEDFLGGRTVNPTSSLASEFQPEYDIQTQKKVLQRRSVLERALAKNDIEKRLLASAERSAAWRWRAALHLPKPASAQLGHERALAMAAKGLQVPSHPNSRVLDVTVDSLEFGCDWTCKPLDRKSTRLNSSHTVISYAVFCLKKKKKTAYVT